MIVLLKYYLDLFHDAVCRLARRGDEAGHGDGERQNDRLGNRNVVHGHGHGDEDGDGHGNECALRQVLLLYKHTKKSEISIIFMGNKETWYLRCRTCLGAFSDGVWSTHRGFGLCDRFAQ